ncbi:MAG: family 78 glycoside hydrolase catalytic domain [Gammaproteobacteria bacterium]|nr:family 78 glycoside hydrolase catalytic domain [Gammaproteobacteria bacterium]
MPGAPSRLRCEYLTNPLGIDELRPRLSWWVTDDRPAELQTSYHVLVGRDREALQGDVADLWDSGRVESNQIANIEYEGNALTSGQRAWWKVRTYDSDGLPSAWSECAYFEMGLLNPEDWRARWIAAPTMGSRDTGVPVPAFRKEFSVSGPVQSARLYITALGLYTAEINAQRVSDCELAPGWTDYRQRLPYQVFDVTEHVATGNNALGVLLGDGWYCGTFHDDLRQGYGDRPALLAQLRVELEDGTVQFVNTDHEWKWHNSWILSSDLRRGEHVDARQRMFGWTTPGFRDLGWQPIDVVAPEVDLVATMHPHVAVLRLIPPTEALDVRSTSAGETRCLVDFGQLLFGRVRLTINATRGDGFRVRYGETLGPDGELASTTAVDSYTALGEDGEAFEPVFSIRRFRYAEVVGELALDGIVEARAVVVGSALEVSGQFRSDHALLNQLQTNIQSTQASICVDVPMSGVQPAPRVPLGHEFLPFVRTAAFNMNMVAFLGKWLSDLCDAQRSDGSFPATSPVPPRSVLPDDVLGSSEVFINVVWVLFRCYGDNRVLQRFYPNVCRFVNLLTQNLEKRSSLVRSGLLSGDDATPNDLVGTALFHHAARMTARMAGVLGRINDLETFDALAGRIRSEFRKSFVSSSGRLVGETQTAYVLALQFGLLEGEEVQHAVRTLGGLIEANSYHADVHPIAAPYLLTVLTREGRIDLAYALMLQISSPSWLYAVRQNATSLWETGSIEMTGNLAAGAVGEWMYRYLAGLDVDMELNSGDDAYRRVRIQPRPPLGVGFAEGPPLRYVEASLATVAGRFKTRWEITDEAFGLRVTVPCNCSAHVIMPDDTEYEIVAGAHEFRMDLQQGGDGIPILREVSQAS